MLFSPKCHIIGNHRFVVNINLQPGSNTNENKINIYLLVVTMGIKEDYISCINFLIELYTHIDLLISSI